MTLREFANLVYEVLGNIKIEHLTIVFVILLFIQLPSSIMRCFSSDNYRILLRKERKKVKRGDYDE